MVVETELEPGQRLQYFPQNKPLVTIPNSLAESTVNFLVLHTHGQNREAFDLEE